MKKKLVVFITALVMVFACALGLVACGDDFDEGTYLMYALVEVGDQKVATEAGMELKFKDGKVTSDQGEGTYKVDGDKLTVTIDGEALKFTKKDNYWKATDEGMTIALCKKGSTPKGYEVQDIDL